jgi:hypothetical protein
MRAGRKLRTNYKVDHVVLPSFTHHLGVGLIHARIAEWRLPILELTVVSYW